MKNKFIKIFSFVALIAVVGPTLLYAQSVVPVGLQRNPSAGTIYIPYLTDKFGIGTTSPYAPLSVVGEVVGQRFTATSTTATSTFSGIVGIGTTTPESGKGTKLDIDNVFRFRPYPPTATPGVSFNYNLGTTSVAVPHRSALQIVNQDGDFPAIYLDSFGLRPIINFRAAGGTGASPTFSPVDFELGRVGFRGFQNTTNAFTGTVSAISGFAAEDFTSTAQGSYLVFKTTNIGNIGGGTSTVPPEVVRIQPSGGVSIGNSITNFTDLGFGSLYADGKAGFSTSSPSGRVAITASSTLSNSDRLLVLADSSNAEQFAFETDGDLRFGTGAILDSASVNDVNVNGHLSAAFGVWTRATGGSRTNGFDAATTGNLAFKVNGANNIVNMLSTGNVGIGTSSPFGKLSIGRHNESTSVPTFLIASSSTGVATSTNFMVMNNRTSIGATSTVSTLGLACNATTNDICFGVSNGVGNPIMNLLGRGSLVIGSSTAVNTGAVNPLISTNSSNASQLVWEASNGNNTATAGVRFDLKRCRTSVTGCTAVQSGDRIGNISFFGHNGTGFTQDAQIIVNATGTPSTRTATTMSFQTSNTSSSVEALRITSSQDVVLSNGSITDTSPARFFIDNEATTLTNDYFRIGPSSDTTLSDFVVKPTTGFVGVATTSPWRTLSVVGTMSVNGLTLNTGAAAASVCLSSTNEITRNTDNETCLASSIRYKENVRVLRGGLAKILDLKPVTFDYKDGSGKNKIGLIAEDVARVDEHLVSVDDGGVPNGIRWSHVTTMLIQGVQDIVARLTGLEEKLNEQQRTIEALDARLKALEK